MKMLCSSNNLLRNILLLLGLSVCITASAFSIEQIFQSISTRLLGRSLPGSLAFAPAGAVGYFEAPVGPDSPGVPTTYPFGEALAAFDSINAADENLADSTMVKTVTQTGSAGKDVVMSSISLVVPTALFLFLSTV